MSTTSIKQLQGIHYIYMCMYIYIYIYLIKEKHSKCKKIYGWHAKKYANSMQTMWER